jgi:hypothetical protein
MVPGRVNPAIAVTAASCALSTAGSRLLAAPFGLRQVEDLCADGEGP